MIGPSTKTAVVLLITAGTTLQLSACGAQPADAIIERHAAALSTGPGLIATATLAQATDFAGLTDLLENGAPQNVLGGIGSGLTWAGGTTFLAVPDRGLPDCTGSAEAPPSPGVATSSVIR